MHTLSPQGRAQFTEAALVDRPARFYRVRVPWPRRACHHAAAD